MPRLLFLAFEKPPHPDAVCHPATEEDVLLAIDWLSAPSMHRRQRSEQLRRYLAQQAGIVPWQRPGVPCRRSSGLYIIVPWRFAKWLSVVLPATDGLIERTRQRLRHWLAEGAKSPVMNATS